MNKTVAALAISASSSAFGLMNPGIVKSKTVCLELGIGQNRALYAKNCDESRNNIILKKPILANGCARRQVAMRVDVYKNGQTNPQIHACLRPNIAQL